MIYFDTDTMREIVLSILNAQNVTHGFGARQILNNASFQLLKGEHVGLVGANGEGKSTFLNIIMGKLQPDQGNIEWCNRITVGYLDQHTALPAGSTIRDVLKGAFGHMFELEKEMLDLYEKMTSQDAEIDKMLETVGDIQALLEQSGFYAIDTKINEVANGLGLGEIGLDRMVHELSGGQRSKVLLTKLILENPMILILDEPTNFLDENHINWLTQFLINHENALVLVSHDTAFMSNVVNVIYHIEDGNMQRYTGSYEQFLEALSLKKRQHEQAYKKQQKEIDKLETFVAKNKARAATATLARSKQKQLDKMEIVDKWKEKPKPTFGFKTARTPGKVIFKATDLVLGYNEPLTKSISIEMERNKKIAIKGVNGLGKSTLLKTLLGVIPPISGLIELDPYLEPGYFMQEDSGDNKKTALQEIWDEFPTMTNAEVRGALARCGLTADHIESQMRVLSGGENAKVRLCKIMLRQLNWLVLDEPTNHLDVEAKAELSRALKEFSGTILLVCHEPSFYDDWISEVWNLESWTTKIV
jgi:ATPase subunit of ABC transporter with duplicated ATPase domains